MIDAGGRASSAIPFLVAQVLVPVSEKRRHGMHSLRHTLATRTEDGTSTLMLLARSRYASVRSLERYARPGPEVVARHVAAADPAARRRRP